MKASELNIQILISLGNANKAFKSGNTITAKNCLDKLEQQKGFLIESLSSELPDVPKETLQLIVNTLHK